MEPSGTFTERCTHPRAPLWLGLRLENANRDSKQPVEQERRRSGCVPCTLPIFTPQTSQISSPGQAVIAQSLWGEWSTRGQIRGRVVRTETRLSQAAATTVLLWNG